MWLPLEGQPLVVRMAKRIRPLVDDVIISTNTPEPFRSLASTLPMGVRTVVDQHPGMGPLAGLYSGLSAARHDLVVVLAVDMPFVSVRLLQYMICQAGTFDAVVPLVSRGETESAWEPLHAVYKRSCLPAILSCLAAGEKKVIRFFSSIRVRCVLPEEIRRFDPDLSSFTNLNTPEDWHMAELLVTQRRSRGRLVQQHLGASGQMYGHHAEGDVSTPSISYMADSAA